MDQGARYEKGCIEFQAICFDVKGNHTGFALLERLTFRPQTVPVPGQVDVILQGKLHVGTVNNAQ
jgi:hypothetical protein